MHHSSTTLSNGATILIAGRQSPYFMCNIMLKVTLQITENCDASSGFQNGHNSLTSPSAQSVKRVSLPQENFNSEDDVISQSHSDNKISSQSLESHNLSKTFDFKLGELTIEVVEQKGSVPRERWRHASVVVMHEGRYLKKDKESPETLKLYSYF